MAKKSKMWSNLSSFLLMGMIFVALFTAYIYRDKIQQFFSPISSGGEKDEEGFPVFIKIYAEDQLTGSKLASADIYIYDAQGNYVEKITTDTDGVGQSVGEYNTGQVIYVQAKKSGYYTTPLQQFVIPTNVPAEHTVVSIGKVSLLKITTSVTLSGTNGTGYSLSNNAQLNGSEAVSLNLLISGLDSDTGYGAPSDYTDKESGIEYKGGVILVIKLSNTKVTPETDWDYGGTVGTDRYFVYFLPNVVDDSDVATDGTLSVNIMLRFSTTGTCTLNIYIYDNIRISAIESLSFGTADASITSVTLRYS